MKRISLDRWWRFALCDPETKRPLPGTEHQPVDLPHDFTIHADVTADAISKGATGYYPGGCGEYIRDINIPEEWKDKKILVEFDGSYGYTTVVFDGTEVTCHPYGYTPFRADISDLARPGRTGRLSVCVDNSAQLNTRWYSGSGLYRHVDILVSGPVHIAPWGIYAHTDRVENGTAYVTVEVTVQNETGVPGDYRVSAEMGGICGKRAVHVGADRSSVCRLKLIIPDARIWDICDPQLYTVNASLEDLGGDVIDSGSVSFGVRTVSADVKNGFMLNGRTLKLKGACVHHDNGLLGAASFRDSEYRKFSLLKKHGFNAVRCAHNPPSREMLGVCDELGLLVIDEAFDHWNIQKNDNDYHLYFKEWWERDLESFVLRDRNHPCVVIWSTGNEVEERAGLCDGYETGRMLADRFRLLDPTRPVTNALCGVWSGFTEEEGEKMREERELMAKGLVSREPPTFEDSIWAKYTETFAAALDIVGYNYQSRRYDMDGDLYPDRLICGTETFPLEIDTNWEKVERLPYVIGDFVWTGFDYIGEAGIGKAEYFNENGENISPPDALWRLANDSDFDICGFERPQLHYRKIVWGSDETFIAARDPRNCGYRESVSAWGWPVCENHWNWTGNEGKPTQVDVYSAAEEVELILNGQSLGSRPAGKANRYRARFDLTYMPGTLTAISYTNGREVSRDELRTTGRPAALKLTSDVKTLHADGHSLAYITGEITDSEGRRVPDAEALCRASVTGDGSLAAFGIARPVTNENYTTGTFTAYQGRILAIVRSGWTEGAVKVKIEAEGIGTQQTVLNVIPEH